MHLEIVYPETNFVNKARKNEMPFTHTFKNQLGLEIACCLTE